MSSALAVNSRVDLSPQQHHRRREVKVDKQTYGRPEAAVGKAVTREVRQEKREAQRSDRPRDHGEDSPGRREPERPIGVGDEAIDDRQHPRQQDECYREAQPSPQRYPRFVQPRQPREPPRHPRSDQHEPTGDDQGEREEGTEYQGKGEPLPPRACLLDRASDVQGLRQGEGYRSDRPQRYDDAEGEQSSPCLLSRLLDQRAQELRLGSTLFGYGF